MSIHTALKKTKLPKNLFYIDLRFFNVAMSKLKRVINFYKKNGELPDVDTILGKWIESRDRVPKIKLWKEIAKPLIKQAGLPENLFPS